MSICDQLDANVYPWNVPRKPGFFTQCNTRSPKGYLCTRPKGHGGDHHAHKCSPQEPGDCVDVWANEQDEGV